MRVFYHGIKENNGGLENFAKNLIQAVVNKDEKIKFTLLVECEDFSYRELFEKLGCEIVVLANSRKHPFKFYSQLLSVFEKADKEDSVAQLNLCSYRNYFLFKACKKTKMKTIIVGHYTKIEGKLGFLHYLNRKLFSKFGLKVTNSDDVTNFMFKDKKHVFFVDNGIPCQTFSYSLIDRQEIRKDLALVDNCFLIGQIGRISSEKNQLFSIKAFEDFRSKTNCDSKLLFIGKEMTSEPREYVSNSKYKEDIIFLGPVYSNIFKYYSAFDCCLLPSVHEGMSLSLLECCSNGVDSVFSNAVPKLKVNCPQTRYLPLDESIWADALIKIYNEKMNIRKNSLLGTIYDIDVCAGKYLDIYYNYDKVIKQINYGDK